jgi:hypothetical protein
LKNRLAFDGYGLFVLPKVQLSPEKFKELLTQDLIKKAQQKYKLQFKQVEKDYFSYSSGENKFFIPTTQKKVLIYGNLLTGYAKLGIIANS